MTEIKLEEIKKEFVEHEPSSEELYIAAFHNNEDIKFKQEVKLNNLNGDNRKYRKVDFELVNLGVYLEYFGMYNSTKEIRSEYDFKASVYIKNNIPTVIIYPHELGILEYAFHTKLIRLLKLKKFNLRRQLFRYRLNRYLTKSPEKFNLFFISFFALFILAEIPTIVTFELKVIIVFPCLLLFIKSILMFLMDVHRYFYKDK